MDIDKAKYLVKEIVDTIGFKTMFTEIYQKETSEAIKTVLSELESKDKEIEELKNCIFTDSYNCDDCKIAGACGYAMKAMIKLENSNKALKEECVSKDKVIEVMANYIQSENGGIIKYGETIEEIKSYFENLVKGSE